MIDIETRYDTGDVITINKKEWTITEIRMVGWQWVYELEREDKHRAIRHCSIETGSLEIIVGDS